MDRVLERHAERLGLDAATQAEIETLSEESRAARRASQERLRVLHDEMRALLAVEVPDEAGVMAQAERIGAAEVELEKHRLRSMIRIRALLTPEQREELVRIHAENEGRRGERREGRRPPRHGPRRDGDRPPPPRF